MCSNHRRLSGTVAAALSLLTLGGSLASEYAVDSASVKVRGNSTAWIYLRGIGRLSDEAFPLDFGRFFRGLIAATTIMADRCYYRDGESREYFVNATFANVPNAEATACVFNNSSQRFLVSDVCVIPELLALKEEIHCMWNSTSGRFFPGPSNNATTADLSVLSEIRGGEGPTARNGSRGLIVHECNGQQCFYRSYFHRVFDAQMYCNRAGPPDRKFPNQVTCLYVSERWMLMTIFDMTTGLPVGMRYPSRAGANNPELVFRNIRGASAFGNTSMVGLAVLHLFQDFFLRKSIPVFGRREGVILMLLLEGFGHQADLWLVHDPREDEDKVYTQVNLVLFIPLLATSIVLVTGAILVGLNQPKRGFVLQVPVSTGQLMSCARAREACSGEEAFGHPEPNLQTGIVTDSEDGEEKQKFSVDARNTVPYKPGVQWLGGTADKSRESSL